MAIVAAVPSVGAIHGRRRQSGVDRPIHLPYVEWRFSIRAWPYGANNRKAGIVESGHRGGGARSPDISIDHREDSLVGHPGAAAKAAKQRDGRPEDDWRWNYCRTGREGPGVRRPVVPSGLPARSVAPEVTVAV